MIGTTRYWDDFLIYYDKASILQTMNIQSETGRNVDAHPGFDDPLMQWVTIYDCVERRYAGFSNALQQVWFGSKNPKRWQARSEFDGLHHVYTPVEWLFLFLVHRLTGSGASFSHDHGFRNSVVADLALKCEQAGEMKKLLLTEMWRGRPVFTSIGNQIPPFPAVPPNYVAFKRPSEYYLSEFAPGLVHATIDWLNSQTNRASVADATDFACRWNKDNGAKQFKFVLAAWCMDIGEYFPEYVDPYSRCHYGKNAYESMDAIFEFPGRKDYDAAMEMVCERCVAPGSGEVRGRPYSLEDVLCDYVRYVERYVPKGYEHLKPHQIVNSSLVDHHTFHPSYHAVLERSS